ncbi:hypothetical protein ACIBI8_37445 [Streptomyces sp. NPDC050529]|uniref:hypothetical protein n=1 Tax=Streptomyces sp. NPDC050529 TaxID=3365624 RepID=UPI003795FFDA
MTTTPPAPAPDTTAAADQGLADRCQSSGDYLAGLLAAATLEAAGTVRKMPTDLFPDWDPVMVETVWQAALPVGYRAGQMSVRPSWTPDALNRLRDALADAGYTAMAAKAGRSARLHPPRHPADDEVLDADVPMVRGGGHP